MRKIIFVAFIGYLFMHALPVTVRGQADENLLNLGKASYEKLVQNGTKVKVTDTDIVYLARLNDRLVASYENRMDSGEIDRFIALVAKDEAKALIYTLNCISDGWVYGKRINSKGELSSKALLEVDKASTEMTDQLYLNLTISAAALINTAPAKEFQEVVVEDKEALGRGIMILVAEYYIERANMYMNPKN